MILGIETSSSLTSVAIAHEGRVVVKNSLPGSVSHSESLAQLVRNLMLDGGIEPSALSAIVIGRGPGSFTGLRIGFAFAKGLALSLRIPLCPVSSLAGLVWGARRAGSLVSAVRDARRGEVFFEKYSHEASGRLELVEGPLILGVEAVLARGGATLVADAGLDSLPQGTLQGTASAEYTIAAWKALGGSVPPLDLSQVIGLEPLYVRAVAAKSIAERQGMPG